MFTLKPSKNTKFFFGKEDTNLINPKNGKILVNDPYTLDNPDFLNKLKEVPSYFYASKNKQEIIDITNELIQTNNSWELHKILQEVSKSAASQKIIGNSPTKMKQMSAQLEKDETKCMARNTLVGLGLKFDCCTTFATGFSSTIWGVTKKLLQANTLCSIEPKDNANDIHLFITVVRDRYIYLVNILKDYKIKFANMDLGRNKNSLIIERVRLDLYPENIQAPQNWELEQIIIIDSRIGNILPSTSPITIRPCGNVRTLKNLCMFDEIYKFLFAIHSAIPKNMQINYEKIFSAIVTAKYNATEEIKKNHKHTKQFLDRLKFTMLFCTKREKNHKTIGEYLKKHAANKETIYSFLNEISIAFFINKIKVTDKNNTIPDEIWVTFLLFCNSFGHITACDKKHLNEKTKLEVKLHSTLNCLAKNKKISHELHFFLCVLLIKVIHGWNQNYYHKLHYFIRNHFNICSSDLRHVIHNVLYTSEMIFFLLCAGHPKEALKYNNNEDWLEDEAKKVIFENYFPLGNKVANDTTSIIQGFIKHAGIQKMWGWRLHNKYRKSWDFWERLRTFTAIYNEDKNKLSKLTSEVAHILTPFFGKLSTNSNNLFTKNRDENFLALTEAAQELMPKKLSEYKDFSDIDCFLYDIKVTLESNKIRVVSSYNKLSIDIIIPSFTQNLIMFLTEYRNAFSSLLIDTIKKNPNSRQKLFNEHKNNINYMITNNIININGHKSIFDLYDTAPKKPRELQSFKYQDIVSSDIVRITRESIVSLIGKAKLYTGCGSNDPAQLLKTINKINFFNSINSISYFQKISNLSHLLTMLPELNTKNPIIAIKHNNNEVKTAIIKGNVIIIGDIHGDFESLVIIINQLQFFLDTGGKVVFLGDLIDMRAAKDDESIAVVLLVFRLHIQYGNQVIILRGNHEYIETMNSEKFGHLWTLNTTTMTEKTLKNTLNSISSKSPITALHLSPKGISSISHAAPFYIPKSLIELLSGGFFHSNCNVCTWNDIDANEKKQEGADSKRGKGIKLVGKNTKAALQKMNVIRHVLGHLHVNGTFHKFFHSISSGNFYPLDKYKKLGVTDKKDIQKVGFLTADGDFRYIRDINKIQEGINNILSEA